MVACMTPWSNSARQPASASISASDAARLGTGLARVADVGRALARSRSRARRPRARRARSPASARSRPASPRARSPPRPSRTGAPACARRARATLIAVPRASIASRNSGKVSNGQSLPTPARSASSDMPSTLSSVRRIRSRCCRPRRRDAEAAVADHHGRDAVPGRDRQHAIPEHLRVVVRVDVDEARRDGAAARVERARGAAAHVAERGDAPAADADVAAARRARRCRRRACRRGSGGRRIRSSPLPVAAW